MVSDYHLHTPLCHHASGTPTDYARRAVELGFDEIGLSDHNPMPTHFDDWRMSLEDFPAYLNSIAEARAACPQLTIRLGMECDYLEGHLGWIDELAAMAPFDYLIGSVHYVALDWALDDPAHLARWRGTGAVEEIWSEYWRLYERMVRTRLFDIHAHPDLPKKFGLRPQGDLRPYYEPTIQALHDTGGAIEINTAGLRKECQEMYPSREFLELAFAAGVPLVVSSDSHATAEVGHRFEDAVSLAWEVGFRSTLRFEGRSRRVVSL